MPNVVYLFGAGVNQVVKDWGGLSPPLLGNFFNVALSLKRIKRNDQHYSKQLQGVYGYIEKYFKKPKEDLAKSTFDLETCFTLLERQIRQVQSEGRPSDFQKLVEIRFQLTSFLAEVLSEFEHFAVTSHIMRNLGRVILYEKPIILTFNYDCIMESVLEMASGVNPKIPKVCVDRVLYEHDVLPEDLPDDLLVYSHSK